MRGQGAFPNIKWTPTLTAKLVRLRSIGLTVAQLAERFVTAETAIRKKLRQVRAVRTAAPLWTVDETRKLLALLAGGATHREAAAIVGKTTQAVHGRVHRLRQANKMTRAPERRCYVVMEHRL